MSTRSSDDLMLDAIARELTELDLGPVPAAPVASVLRVGRRRRSARNVLSTGAVLAAVTAAAVVVSVTVSSGDGAAVRTSAPPATRSAQPVPSPSVTSSPPALVDWNTKLDPHRTPAAVTVRSGRKIEQTWGTIWLRYRQRCFQLRSEEPTCQRYDPENSGTENSIGLYLSANLSAVSIGGIFVGREPPADVVLRVGRVTAHALVLTLPGRPGWAAWTVDGPAVQAAWGYRGSQLQDGISGEVPYSITAYDASGRVLARMASSLSGPAHCDRGVCSRTPAPGGTQDVP